MLKCTATETGVSLNGQIQRRTNGVNVLTNTSVVTGRHLSARRPQPRTELYYVLVSARDRMHVSEGQRVPLNGHLVEHLFLKVPGALRDTTITQFSLHLHRSVLSASDLDSQASQEMFKSSSG